jgi:hypothetical protein
MSEELEEAGRKALDELMAQTVRAEWARIAALDRPTALEQVILKVAEESRLRRLYGEGGQ